ncbi:MAG: PilN domain-containing protein [Acetobacteraceae bacterium]
MTAVRPRGAGSRGARPRGARSRAARPRDAGVTLIETLIAVTLLAMLGTVIATGTRIGGRAWGSAERQTAEIEDIDTVQALLRRMVARAQPAYASSDPSDRLVAFAGGPDAMTIVTPQPGGGDGGPWTIVRFHLARDGAGSALALSWRYDAPAAGRTSGTPDPPARARGRAVVRLFWPGRGRQRGGVAGELDGRRPPARPRAHRRPPQPALPALARHRHRDPRHRQCRLRAEQHRAELQPGTALMAGLGDLSATGGALIRQGVTWWVDELKGMVPGRAAGQRQPAPAILDVAAHTTTLLLTDRRSAQTQVVALTGIDPEAARGLVETALRRQPSNAVVIRLDASLLLRNSLTLPLAAAGSLRPILQNQLDRLVPLPVDQLYFEYRIVQRSPVAKTLTVEVFVAMRDNVDRAVDLARSLGLQPRMVVAGHADAAGELPVVLWRPERQASTSRTQRVLRRSLEVAAVLLVAGAITTYIERLDGLRDELQEEVQLATRAAGAARDLTRRQGQTEATLAVLERRQGEPTPLLVLNEITALVPHTMWVSQLLLRGKTVEIIGISPRVSDLLTRINSSDMFTNLQFRSPVTRSQDGSGERFDLSFDVLAEVRK